MIPCAGAASRRRGAQNDWPGGFAGVSRSVLTVIIILILTATTLAAASPPLASIKLAETPAPVEIVRCHLDEGRIVIRHGDKLHVLHAGDELAVSGLRVLSMTPDAATIAIRQSSPTPSLRIIRISMTGNGAIALREFATNPEALQSGSGAKSNPMSSIARIAMPAAPPGAD